MRAAKEIKSGIGIVMLAMGITVGAANAETTTGHAYAELVQTIGINEVESIDYDIVRTGNGMCELDETSRLIGDACIRPDNGRKGKIMLVGTPNQTVKISVSQGLADRGVVFLPVIGSGNVRSEQLNSEGQYELSVSGLININSMLPGSRNLSYYVSVNYE